MAAFGLTLAALIASRVVTSNRLISSRNRHHVNAIDKNAFNKLADALSEA